MLYCYTQAQQCDRNAAIDTQAQQCDRNAVLLYSSAVWSPEYICARKDFQMPLKTMGSRTFQVCLLGIPCAYGRRGSKIRRVCLVVLFEWISTAYKWENILLVVLFFFFHCYHLFYLLHEHHHCHWCCIGQLILPSVIIIHSTIHNTHNL